MNRHEPQLTLDELRTRLRYDVSSGIFYWLTTKGGRRLGEPAGASTPYGHVFIRINRTRYMAHNLAFLFSYGTWPHAILDHIDGNPANNRISNLREANQSLNLKNARRSARNTSGMTGVSWNKNAAKWMASGRSQDRNHYLGIYTRFEDAVAARKLWEAKHDFHPNHGRVA